MNTIQSLESFLFSLNITGESPDDTEAFYDFCISSCINDEFIVQDIFFEKFKSAKNILDKQCSDEDIKKYFARYETYFDLLRYANRNGFLQENKEK